ncbi:MAG: menaquinone biosynthesis protein [Alicyclobacillaceae bacterium]|nr:menaquinone biosynthesis protein [Alicyclobacillaceae bacterium]
MNMLRIGRIEYMNVLPVFHFFQHEQVELIPSVPSQLNTWLERGEVDLGPVSSFAFGRHPDDYVVLRDLSVSSRGPVGSIFLVSTRPVSALHNRVVALTRSSATSVNLLKILFARRFEIHAKYVTMDPDLDQMLQAADAALLIGDDALRVAMNPRGLTLIDLGEVWWEWTGLGMVFAVWAVRKEVAERAPDLLRSVHRAFRTARDRGLREIETVIHAARQACGGDVGFWRDYYEKLCYDLQDDLVEGLHRYYREAYELGLLPTSPNVRLWGDP